MDNKYKLVLATENDYDFIYEAKKNAYIRYVEANWGSWNEEFQKEMFEKFIEKYKKEINIITLNGVRIGFYHGETLENGDFEIVNICIIPEYQGKGIGTEVLNDVIEEHKNQNILIQYFKQNPVGNLYARLGFMPYKETEYHYQMMKKVSV